MSLRVTGGCLRGRQVRTPPGIIRPAMDKMRESMFAILGDLQNASFLDLFSGSGIIAVEAASRGAYPVEAVESDLKKKPVLTANCAISPSRINCRFMPTELYIKRAKRAWDYIFCDPPFNYRYKLELLERIALSKLIHQASIVFIHRPKAEILPDYIGTIKLFDQRRYGQSIVDFFRVETPVLSR